MTIAKIEAMMKTCIGYDLVVWPFSDRFVVFISILRAVIIIKILTLINFRLLPRRVMYYTIKLMHIASAYGPKL